MARVSRHKGKGPEACLKARALLCGGLTLIAALSLNLSHSAQPGQAIMGSLDSPMDLRLQAMDYLLKGDKEQALGLYGTAIDAASETYGANSIFLADLCYEAGALANRMDKFDKAENYLRQAVTINPRLAMARMELADVSRRRNRPMVALEQIQQDLANHPDSLIARQQFIRWLGANGKTPTEKSIAQQESLRLLAAIHRNQAPAVHINETKPLQKSAEKTAPVKAAPLTAPDKAEAPVSSFRLPGRPNLNPATPAPAATTSPATSPAQTRATEEKVQKVRKVEKPKKVERVEKPEPKPHKEVKPAPVKEPPPQPVKEKPPAPKQTKEAVAEEKPKKEKVEKQAKQAEQVVPQTVPSMPVQPGYPMYSPVPVMVSPPAKVGKGKGGLVPPPPPTMPPLYPGMAPGMAPMPMPMIMPQQQQPPKPKKEKPKAPPKKVEEEPKEVEDKPPPMQNPPSDQDGDFMLDWGGVKKGKGK